MTLTWKRDSLGNYSGNTMAFNHSTGKHEPIFNLVRIGNSGWSVMECGNCISNRPLKTLSEAKRLAQEIEYTRPAYKTDEDEGMANASYAPGQTISTYISAERIGGRLYVSEDGKALISETRWPDGRITTERREYGN